METHGMPQLYIRIGLLTPFLTLWSHFEIRTKNLLSILKLLRTCHISLNQGQLQKRQKGGSIFLSQDKIQFIRLRKLNQEQNGNIPRKLQNTAKVRLGANQIAYQGTFAIMSVENCNHHRLIMIMRMNMIMTMMVMLMMMNIMIVVVAIFIMDSPCLVESRGSYW